MPFRSAKAAVGRELDAPIDTDAIPNGGRMRFSARASRGIDYHSKLGAKAALVEGCSVWARRGPDVRAYARNYRY
jgi:hypothetical protein